MAIKKISELTAFVGSPEVGDLLPIVDTSANETKKIDASLFKGDTGPIGPASTPDNILFPKIGTPSLNTLQDMHNIYNSVGVLTGGLLTDIGGGNISIGIGIGALRAVDNITDNLLFFEWTEFASEAITADVITYLYIEYNAGVPQLVKTPTKRTDLNTNIYLGKVLSTLGTVHINEIDKCVVSDIGFKTCERFKDTEPFQHVSGASISEIGVRNVAITAGIFWHDLTKLLTLAFDSSAAGTFDGFYRDGSGGWNVNTDLTQTPNEFYDNNSGTLQVLGSNNYVTRWFYLESDNDVVMVYGRGDHNTLSAAQDEPAPADVPPEVQLHGFLVGRTIIQKAAASSTQVDSAFVSTFSASQPTEHNTLTGLQGGVSGEYYHMKVVEFNAVSGLGVKSALAAVDIDMSSDQIKTKTIANNTVFTISNPTLDKTVSIRVDGDFTITLPSTVKNKVEAENSYNGSKVNLINIWCIDTSTPEYWATVLVGD